MKLDQLLKTIKFGDKYRCGNNDWAEYSSKGYWADDLVLRDDWEIKKKEEGPITAEEYYAKQRHILAPFYAENRKIGFIDGEKNNDLKYKELVEYLKTFHERGNCIIHKDEFVNYLLSKIKK